MEKAKTDHCKAESKGREKNNKKKFQKREKSFKFHTSNHFHFKPQKLVELKKEKKNQMNKV